MLGKNLMVCLLAAAAPLLLPSSVRAQAAVNPTRAVFNPSPDHNVTGSTGLPVVSSYDLELFLVGAAAPFQVVTLGKPTPDGLGVINVDLTTIFMGWPVVGMNYVADVAAVGAGGNAPSERSNNFSFTGSTTCNYVLSSTAQTVAAVGGSGTSTVTTSSGCAWSAMSNTAWITVTGGGGTGNGTLTYAVAANASASARTGTLTVAGGTITVTQSGACAFALSAESQSVPAAGGALDTTVTTASGCTWNAVSNETWMTVTGGSTRTGTGTVTYTVAANTSTDPRTGTLTLAGQTLTVTEAGAILLSPPHGVRVVQ